MMYVLLSSMYEGDDYFIDNIFEAVSEDIDLLVDLSKKMGSDCVCMPGEILPDDGCWSDTRIRHRIIEVKPIKLDDMRSNAKWLDSYDDELPRSDVDECSLLKSIRDFYSQLIRDKKDTEIRIARYLINGEKTE